MNCLYKQFYIDEFKLTKESQTITFNSYNSLLEMHNSYTLGINNTLIYSSPNSKYTDNCNFLVNNMFYDMNKIVYNSVTWEYMLNDDEEIKIEHDIFKFKYSIPSKGLIKYKNITVESIQFKPDKHTSLCIAYDYISNWNSKDNLDIYKDRFVFGLELYDNSKKRNVWYFR